MQPSTSASLLPPSSLSRAERRKEAWRWLCTCEKCQLSLVFGLFVLLRAMDRVFNKRVNDRMANYQLSYVNLFWPVGVQVREALCVT